MGKGRFVNQKLAKRTGQAQRQQKFKLAPIPGGGKKHRAIINPSAPNSSGKDRGKTGS